jgi:signal transduction histidine kinase
VALQWAICGLMIACFGAIFFAAFRISDFLRRQNQALLALEEAKNLLIGMVVHDLRNPLTAAIALIEVAHADLPPSLTQLQTDLANALFSCRRMLAMITVLLDTTRMEDGKMPITKGSHDLAHLVRSKTEEYGAAARGRGLRLVSKTPERPVEAHIDANLVGRVVENLITNALKHTQHGGEVAVELEAPAGATSLRLKIRDNGEGIAAEHLPLLFEKYGRVAGQTQGTGFGLVFCRMAVELHGGSIAVESRLGEGTLFSIELPSTTAAPVPS